MQSYIPDSELHLGHRERMRRKLLAYDREIFDTYELLEMLLYTVIPVRDTNPVAKRLLATFGGLDGVLSADCESLMAVDGVGKAVADYITAVGKLPAIISSVCKRNPEISSSDDAEGGVISLFCGDKGNSKRLLSDDDIGNYFVEYFKDKDEYTVSMLLFDNLMRPIRVVDIYNCDYGKGSVHSKAFLDIALKNRASCVAIAHNHPYGPLYPSHSDILTHKLIAEGFIHSGVELLDHYLVCGSGYLCIGEMATKADGCNSLLHNFGIVCVKTNVRAVGGMSSSGNFASEQADYLASLLGYSISDGEKCREIAFELINAYHSLEGVLCRSYDELCAVLGSAAVSLKLVAHVNSRRFTDKYGRGKKYGDWIKEYFVWYFFGISHECVYLALFDKKQKLISINKLSEGTINSSEIMPRKAMEISTSAGASFALLAHNHPGGSSVGSEGDVYATAVISRVLSNVGVELLGHIVAAGIDVGCIDIPASDE